MKEKRFSFSQVEKKIKPKKVLITFVGKSEFREKKYKVK
jgi:hypothetical protein